MRNAQITTVTVESTVTRLLRPSPRRRTVLLTPNDTVAYTVSDQQGVVYGEGLTITPGGGAVELCFAKYGVFIQQELFAIVDTGSASVGVLEAFELDDDERGDRGERGRKKRRDDGLGEDVAEDAAPRQPATRRG